MNSAISSDDGMLDVRYVFKTFWRRKWLLLAVMITGFFAAFLFTAFIPLQYKAQSLVMIQTVKLDEQSIDVQSFLTKIRIDDGQMLSEAEVIKSKELIRALIERLDLMNDPEFNPKAVAINKTAAKDKPSSPDFKSLSLYNQSSSTIPSELLNKDLAITIDRVLSHITVRPVLNTFVMQIMVSSTDPSKAAQIANVLADLYLEQRLETKFNASRKVTSWLDRRLTELRNQVRVSEAAVEKYRSENNLIQGARSEITTQQMTELNSQLVLAKSERAQAQAKLDQALRWASNPSEIDVSSEILNNPFIIDLKTAEIDILRRRSEMMQRYGDKHPLIINSNNELDSIRTKLSVEMEKIVQTLRNDLNVADASMNSLQLSLDEVEGLRKTENEATIRLRELEREAEANRLIFDNFLSTYKRNDDQESLQEPDAKIITYATPPNKPFWPNRPLILSLTTLMSLFLGICIVMLLEHLDDSFRSISQIEMKTGYPCYALIPKAEGVAEENLAEYILEKPSSAVAESVRTLRLVLNLRGERDGQKPRIVSVTSSLPGEGKTTLSSWLGRVAAKSGEKVLVIDCDLRRPNLNRILKAPAEKTLADYLSGQARLEEVIYRKDPSGAHMIFARSVPNTALDLLSSEKMKNLLLSLRQVYDLVILDTAASLAASDARVLANMSDHTLYVVGWDKTPQDVVLNGIKPFSDFGYKKLSFVLSNVDVHRHARYGYGDTGYYYGRFKDYYSN